MKSNILPDNILNLDDNNGDKVSELALKYRKIFINDEINKDTIFNIIYYLHKIVEQDKDTTDKLPIKFYINTVGGYCSEGFILVDLIEQLKSQGYEIITVVSGTAYSFGLILALMGNKRYCYKHCEYMCHTVQIIPSPSSLPDLKKVVDHSERIESFMNDYIIQNSKITQKDLNDKIGNGDDWFFNAEEALKYGMCDKVV